MTCVPHVASMKMWYLVLCCELSLICTNACLCTYLLWSFLKTENYLIWKCSCLKAGKCTMPSNITPYVLEGNIALLLCILRPIPFTKGHFWPLPTLESFSHSRGLLVRAWRLSLFLCSSSLDTKYLQEVNACRSFLGFKISPKCSDTLSLRDIYKFHTFFLNHPNVSLSSFFSLFPMDSLLHLED